MKSVDTVVDTFYGYQSKTDPTVNAPRKLWTKEQTEDIEQLERELAAAETQEDRDALEQKIQDATPQMSGAQTVRGLQKFVQAKGMAWNIPAAIVNMIFVLNPVLIAIGTAMAQPLSVGVGKMVFVAGWFI